MRTEHADTEPSLSAHGNASQGATGLCIRAVQCPPARNAHGSTAVPGLVRLDHVRTVHPAPRKMPHTPDAFSSEIAYDGEG